MDTIIAYVDDAAYALRIITPLLPHGQTAKPVRWILVGCAPRLSRHVSRWVTESARQSWRGVWARKVFDHLAPLLQGSGDVVITKVAQQPLCDLTESLQKQYRGAKVLDARRPKFGQDLAPVTREQYQEPTDKMGYAAIVAGAALLIAAD